MPTQIQLFHVGEVLLANLLDGLARRDDLAIPCMVHPNCTVSGVLANADLHGSVMFSPNVPLSPLANGDTELLFDGAHCVDVLAHQEASIRAVAFEAKLGLDRLSPSEFKKRFLVGLARTNHRAPRVKGSMVAILGHRYLEGFGDLRLRAATPHRELARPWVLVVRRSTWRKWSESAPPQLGPDAHVVCFDDIAAGFGDIGEFDDLVRRLLGDGFAQAWNLQLRSSAEASPEMDSG